MRKMLSLLLQQANVDFLNVLWCDYANIIRGKAFHRNLFETAGEYPVSISLAQLGVSAIGDYVLSDSGYQPVGEIFLKPDWDTLRVLPWLEHFASVMGEMVSRDVQGLFDPRAILKDAREKLGEKGLEIRVAFENEFSLLDSHPGGQPVDDHLFAMPDSTLECAPFIVELSRSLELLGMEVERFYPESGAGQYELTTRYGDALSAADNQVLFRQAVHGVARSFGLGASFLPKLSEEQAGNGCHLHFSLWKEGKNLFAQDFGQQQGEAEHFLQGVLSHLRALSLLSIPSPNSYRRLKPHFWSGAFACWGIDNREAALRAVTVPQGGINHFELKTSDATANPYLALAGLIYCGLAGLEEKKPLQDAVNDDPGNYSQPVLHQKHIVHLPQDLGEAIDRFQEDKVLQGYLGEIFCRPFLAIRKEEYERIRQLTFEHEVALLRDRY
ncbi:MAG TPA: glutamine synthetase family protein [Thermotogota bacterium]|nr:glutamine synthetase family protein [Thermotogota bacterium]HRW92064.1 glutamine synthetase family protein [Thermotogota bacterium]